MPPDWLAGEEGEAEEEAGVARAEASDLLRLGSDTAGGLGLGGAGLAVRGGARTEEGGGRGLCTTLATVQLLRGVAVAEGGVVSETPPPPPLVGLWTLLVVELETSTVPPATGGVAEADGGVVKVAGAGLGALQPVGGAVAAAAHSMRLLASFFSLETLGEEQEAVGEEVQEEDPL